MLHHSFGKGIYYFVLLFTSLPAIVPFFFAHCLGCTISALLSCNSPTPPSPHYKGVALQGQTLLSEISFPGTEIMKASQGCIQGRLKGWAQHENISQLLCHQHNTVVLNLMKIRGGRKTTYFMTKVGSKKEGWFQGNIMEFGVKNM